MRYRKPNRLKFYDYSNSGWYYVTICTNEHKNHFGKIENEKMILNENGEIVENSWNWLSDQYSYCELDGYVIMPNHFHGIIIINPDNLTNVGTSRDLSLRQEPKIKIKSLSELIGAFKTKSSKEIHIAGNINFKWQRSFYDKIIRNEKELFNIRKYIQQNPLKWELNKNINNLEI